MKRGKKRCTVYKQRCDVSLYGDVMGDIGEETARKDGKGGREMEEDGRGERQGGGGGSAYISIDSLVLLELTALSATSSATRTASAIAAVMLQSSTAVVRAPDSTPPRSPRITCGYLDTQMIFYRIRL